MTETVTEEAPLFDVVVQVPNGAKLEEISIQARAAGIAGDRVDQLMKVLQSVPQAKIGSAVSRERADRASVQFKAAGLNVVITPVLSLQAATANRADGLESCPACNQRVALGTDRKCPNCGVYVDKITDEEMLRRKMLQQERQRITSKLDRDARNAEKQIREELEAQLRAKIRAELEEEYGIGKGGGGGMGKWVRIGGISALVAAAFVGGQFMQGAPAWASSFSGFGGSRSGGGKAGDLDSMLDKVGPKGANATAATAAAAAANGGAPTGDPDVDDPLVQAAGGKRIGAKGLSVEQAVAAANTLSKSVGRGPGAGAAAGAAAAGDPAAAAAASAASAPPVTVDPSAKGQMVAEFARELAAIGQQHRAERVLARLKGAPVAKDPAVAAAARLAALEVNAWAVQGMAPAAARKAIENLLAAAGSAADPAERAHGYMRAAVVLANAPQLPADVPRAFLAKAAETIKTIPDPLARPVAADEWMASLGETLALSAEHLVRTGRLALAEAAAADVAALSKQTTDPMLRARLLALESRAWWHVGQEPRSAEALEAALALLATETTASRRAAGLRAVARVVVGPARKKVLAAAESFQPVAQGQQGAERLQALGDVALLYAAAGDHAAATQLAQQAIGGSGAQGSSSAQAALLVRTELAGAKAQHASGRYAECETLLLRVADYVF